MIKNLRDIKIFINTQQLTEELKVQIQHNAKNVINLDDSEKDQSHS